MKKKYKHNAVALMCAMIVTGSNAYSQNYESFDDLKNAVNAGGTIQAELNQSKYDFTEGLDIKGASKVNIQGQGSGSTTLQPKDQNTFKDWAFTVEENGELSLEKLKLDSFGDSSIMGKGIIENKGILNIGPDIVIENGAKSAGYVYGGLIENTGVLNITTDNTGDVTFKKSRAEKRQFDLEMKANSKLNIAGDAGKVTFSNGINSYNSNSTSSITHDGENEVVLGGVNGNYKGTFTNKKGKVTVDSGASFFGGNSTFDGGSLNWNTNTDLAAGSTLTLNKGVDLTVGNATNYASLTISGKSSIEQAKSITVNQNGKLTLGKKTTFDNVVYGTTVNGAGTLTLSGGQTLNLIGQVINDEAGSLHFTSTNGVVNIQDVKEGGKELKVLLGDNANNTALTLNLKNYIGGETEQDITVNGTNVSVLNFEEGTNSHKGDITISNNGVVTNKFQANTTITGTTGTLTNEGKVDNQGKLIAKTINNKGDFESTGSLTADTIINGDDSASSAQINSTGTFEVNKGVTNYAKITGTSASFGTYSGSNEKSILNLTGKLIITAEGETNAIQNSGAVTASSIEVKNGGITNGGSINATSGDINVSGGITNETSGSIEAAGKITAGGAVSNLGKSIQGSELEFYGIENNKGKIESTSGNITIEKTANNDEGEIISAGRLTIAEKLTNTGKIQINGGELADVENSSSGSIINTGDLNIMGDVTGSSGTITHNSGNLTLTGDGSGYTGTFTQIAGTTTANNGLFGGTKNIQSGTLTASGTKMYTGDVNLSGGAKFNYTLNGAEGSITKDLLSFTDGGGSAEFTSANSSNIYTLTDDITGENSGTVTFKDTTLKLVKESDGEYSYKDFILDNSTLTLGDAESSEINNFVFNKFTAKNGSKVDLDVKFSQGNVLQTDSLNVGAGSTGTLELGNIFISDESKVENGENYATKEGEGVLRGTGAGGNGLKLSGSKADVKGATTEFTYDISVNDDGKGIQASVLGLADENSLYKMDSDVTGERFFQFSTKDKEYHIGKSLKETLAGTFTVQGNSDNPADSVLSGKLKQGSTVTENKGSFFNIKNNKVDLTVKNLTIQDADSTQGGSVLHNESENSKVVLENLLIKDNSSQNDKGGAIYNNGGKGTDPSQEDIVGLYVGKTAFEKNTSTGKGGAIYNDSEGFIYLEDITTAAATGEGQNDIYNAGTAYTNGENTFKSLFTNEGEVTFQGENTLSEFVNSGSGTAEFNGTNDVITKFTNNAAATVNSKQIKIDNYTSTKGQVNFSSTNATLNTVIGDANSLITNSGNLTLTGNGSSYAGDFTQTAGSMTVDTGATFFGGNSNVSNGVLNWFTQNNVPNDAKLTISGAETVFNVGDNDTKAGEITFRTGSSISKEVTTNIWKNGTVNVEGGNVTLSQGEWKGSVNLNSGILTLYGLNNYYEDVTGTLTAKAGDLNLTGETQLVLGKGSTIDDAVKANIGEKSQVYLEQGSLTLDNNDTWSGAVVLDDESQGALTLKGYTKDLGKLQASSGSVNITEGSKITFKSDDEYDSGIEKKVQTKIDKTSQVTLGKGGYLELDDDAGTADQWVGTVALAGGTLDYGMKDPKDVGTLNATEGKLNLLSGSVLSIESPSAVGDAVSVDIENGSTVNILTGATFNIDSNTDDKWNGLVKNNGGNFNISGIDNTKGYGGGIQQESGKTTLKDEANIYISDSNSYVSGGDIEIDGKSKLYFGSGIQDLNADNLKMTDGTQVSILNGEIDSARAENVEIEGKANYAVDLNPREGKGDQFEFGSITGTDSTLNISDFNFTGGAPIDRNIDFTLFTGDKSGVEFDATKDLKFTPIGYYGIKSLGEGNYRAYLDHYNPQVFRGQVATMAMYTHQLLVDDMVTNHFILHNDRLLDNAKLANKYAAVSTLFAPYQKTYEDGGLWSKSYVSFDKMDLTQGLSAKNNIYGMLLGADLPAVELKKGWKFIPTGYIGYNGGHQHFDGVSMYQNGGQLGLMGTFIKDKFIGSVTAYGGGYMNDMSVAGFEDNAGNWFAGTAAKAAYNYSPFKDFTVQPNLLFAYNAFGKQNWGTDFGIMSMNSGMLNGVNVAPGLNLILQKNTWSLYGSVSYMYFINDKIDGQAGNVRLPNVRMDHGYIQYGVGATKVWNDRLAAFGQVNIRNAGINGIGFQAGINYMFDFGGKNSKNTKKEHINKAKPQVNTVYDDADKTYIKKVFKQVESN